MIGKETWLTSKAIIPQGIYYDIRLKESPKENNMENQNTTSLKSFHYLENGNIDFSILETKFSTKKLNAGVYNLTAVVKNNEYVTDLNVSNDRELFADDLGFYYEDKIKSIYSKFFMSEIKQKVNSLGYNHKAGILLYGKQGTGKTSMFKKYFNDAVQKHNALVFDVKLTQATPVWWRFLKDIRTIQDNPIIIFLDEFEEYFENRDNQETTMKKILDGTDSIDNCLFFMTTNYIDKVPETIKDRPSRIKYKIEVTGIQDEKLIKQFLKQSFDKIDMKVDFEKEVSKMKGWTIDELKQWVLDKVMDIEPEEKEKKRLGF
jgi:ATP-dependent 26S proteasome regulatory subunit